MRIKSCIKINRSVFKGFFVGLVLLTLVCLLTMSVTAQHIDVFKLDYSKNDEKEDKVDVGFIEVEDRVKYTVAIDKEKLDKKDFNVYDLELLDIPQEDLDKFLWHQVDCLLEENISASQTRVAGPLRCTRSRSGKIYWLANGKKYVHWGRWSFWSCAEKEE